MWFKGTRTLLLVIFSHTCTPVTLLNHLVESLHGHNDFILNILVEKSLLKLLLRALPESNRANKFCRLAHKPT